MLTVIVVSYCMVVDFGSIKCIVILCIFELFIVYSLGVAVSFVFIICMSTVLLTVVVVVVVVVVVYLYSASRSASNALIVS